MRETLLGQLEGFLEEGVPTWVLRGVATRGKARAERSWEHTTCLALTGRRAPGKRLAKGCAGVRGAEGRVPQGEAGRGV